MDKHVTPYFKLKMGANFALYPKKISTRPNLSPLPIIPIPFPSKFSLLHPSLRPTLRSAPHWAINIEVY